MITADVPPAANWIRIACGIDVGVEGTGVGGIAVVGTAVGGAVVAVTTTGVGGRLVLVG